MFTGQAHICHYQESFQNSYIVPFFPPIQDSSFASSCVLYIIHNYVAGVDRNDQILHDSNTQKDHLVL